MIALKCNQSLILRTTAVILDGTVITQMLKPGAAKTFEEYTHQNLLNLLKFIASRAVHCISLTLMIRVHAYAVSAPLKLSSDGAWTVLLSSLFQSAGVLTKNEFLYISVLAKGILI